MEGILQIEKQAVSLLASGDKGKLKPVLETLAAELEKLDAPSAAEFVLHLKALKQVPIFYGVLSEFPKKPTDPYKKGEITGEIPTHDAVTEYEDQIMFYNNQCKEFAKTLAKACRDFLSQQ